jgi:hypothetical protein
MKTFKLSLILLLMLGAFSCKKDSTSSTTSVTTDQAADIAASSLAENSGGLTSVTDDIAVNAQGISSVNTGGLTINSTGQSTSSVHQECGTTLTDSVTKALTIDSVTVNYNFKYTHTLNCNNSVPDNLVNTLTYSGSFNGPRLSSSNTGSATVTIAGLSQSAANFVLNGEYKRSGSFQSKVGNDATGNSNVDIVGTNITLSKPDRKILSGSATISITGTGPRGNSFSFTGTLVFNGDNTATLTINGTVYTINVITGYRLRRL